MPVEMWRPRGKKGKFPPKKLFSPHPPSFGACRMIETFILIILLGGRGTLLPPSSPLLRVAEGVRDPHPSWPGHLPAHSPLSWELRAGSGCAPLPCGPIFSLKEPRIGSIWARLSAVCGTQTPPPPKKNIPINGWSVIDSIQNPGWFWWNEFIKS